jgi:ribosomal protein S19
MEKKKRRRMQRKKRTDYVKSEDRNQVCAVHNGKTYVKRELVNPMYVGLKWGERAKTRKPCRKGANKNLKVRAQLAKKKPVKKS